MEIGGVAFQFGAALEAFRGDDGAIVLEFPHERFANPRGLAPNPYGLGPFARLLAVGLPRRPGVYALTMDGRVQYIGRARDSIARRWGPQGYGSIHPRNCFAGGQSTNCRLNGLITQRLLEGNQFDLWVHEIADPVALESRLIADLRPPWNARG